LPETAPAVPLTPEEAKDLPTVALDGSGPAPRPSPPPRSAPKAPAPSRQKRTSRAAPVLILSTVGILAACLLVGTILAILAFFRDTDSGPSGSSVVVSTVEEPVVPLGKLEPGSGTVLYGDDFSDPGSGWDIYDNGDTEAGYADGGYRLGVYLDNYVTWGNPTPPLALADVQVEVDARAVEGPLDNTFGILVRYQPDDENYYNFQISSDGFYAVDLMQAGEWVSLVAWEESDAIVQGLEATNHLIVICEGDRYYFYVNGTFLVEVTDSTLDSGNIGLLAGTFDEPGVVVHFDNIRVTALSEE